MAVELTSLLDTEQRATGKDERFETTPFFPILQNYQEEGERKILVTFNKGYVISATKLVENGGESAVKSSFAHTAPSNINTVWKLDKDEDVSFSLVFRTKRGSSVIDPNEIRIETDEPSISEADNERLIQIDKDGKSEPVATYRMPMCRIKAGKLVDLVLRENIHWQQPAFSNAEQEEEDYGLLKSPENSLAEASEVNAPPVTFKNLRAGTGIGIESADNFLTISLGNDRVIRDEKDFAAYYDGGFSVRKGRIISRTPDLWTSNGVNVGIRTTVEKSNPFYTVAETAITPENGKFVYLSANYVAESTSQFSFGTNNGFQSRSIRNLYTSYVIDRFENPPSIVQRNEDPSFMAPSYEVWFPIGEFNDEGKFVQKHDGPIILDSFIHITSTDSIV